MLIRRAIEPLKDKNCVDNHLCTIFSVFTILKTMMNRTYSCNSRGTCLQSFNKKMQNQYCQESLIESMIYFSSKIECKDQNGYSTNIKPDIGAAPVSGMTGSGWGSGSTGVPRPGVSTPETMTRYTPSSVDQVARDRAWMNTCSSLSAAAQEH